MLLKLFLGIICFSIFPLSNSHSAPQFPSVNGDVYAIESDGTTAYIGGSFSYIGATTGPFGIVHSSTAAITSGIPIPNGIVRTVISDGSDGWYIGGNFTQVGSVNVQYLARIKSDKTVDTAFAPQPNDVVRALILSGSTLYVGGDFSHIGGIETKGVGKINSTSGIADSSFSISNDGTDYQVNTLNLNSTKLYVGGIFSNLSGSASNFVTLNTSNGVGTTPVVTVSGDVYSLDRNGNTLYLGGNFSSVNSTGRSNIAAVNATSGALSGWDPSADAAVESILFDGSSTVYAAGAFTSIGGQTRTGIAALDSGTGNATSFDYPDGFLDGSSMALSGSSLFVGGDSGLIALNSSSGALESFSPNPRGDIKALAISGSNLAVGGDFSFFGGTARNRAAAITLSTGAISDWNPNANGVVKSIKKSGDKVFLGGSFTTVGGSSRRCALVNATTGALQSFDPGLDGDVNDIEIDNGILYLVGGFNTASGQARSRAAAYNISTESLTSWNPNPDNSVNSIAIDSGVAYLQGDFLNVGGQARAGTGAVSISGTGEATSWVPETLSGSPKQMLPINGTVYVGGTLGSIGNVVRIGAGAISATTGSPTSWNPNFTYPSVIFSLAHDGTNIFLGGEFSQLQNSSVSNLASVTIADAELNVWRPNPDGIVRAVNSLNKSVIVGGDFRKVFGGYQRGIAVVSPLALINSVTSPSGTTTDGEVISAGNDEWAGVGEVTLGYQWQRCSSIGAECYSLDEETGQTRTLSVDDVGNTLKVEVTATDDISSSSITSTLTAIINPLNTKRPKISGTATVGSAIRLSNGSWNRANGLDFEYRWERCNRNLSRCSAINRANRSRYRIQRKDFGKRLRGIVTASKNNSTGTEATSKATSNIR